MGKVIDWELCKKLKFDHINKWYMYKPESIRENEKHEILLDFEMKTDHRFQKIRPSFNQQEKKTCHLKWILVLQLMKEWK